METCLHTVADKYLRLIQYHQQLHIAMLPIRCFPELMFSNDYYNPDLLFYNLPCNGIIRLVAVLTAGKKDCTCIRMVEIQISVSDVLH